MSRADRCLSNPQHLVVAHEHKVNPAWKLRPKRAAPRGGECADNDGSMAHKVIALDTAFRGDTTDRKACSVVGGASHPILLGVLNPALSVD
jgi:hypothetical protein